MNIEALAAVIADASIFRGMTHECVVLNLTKTPYTFKRFAKGEILAVEGEECDCVGIVIEGSLELRKEFPAGHYMTLTYLGPTDIFGEVIVFSNVAKYPATIQANTDTGVLYICKKDLVLMLENCEQVMTNFMKVLSNKILMLNKKTSILSFKSIEEKVASYILEEYKVRKNLTFNIPLKRIELAGYLNVPRPSLSRTMGKMKDDGIIDYYQNTIRILDLEALENCLFNREK